jgi:bifunctional DNase/RNase
VEDRTYFAELQLQRDDLLVNIDARPSDSIAIALRLDAPIFAAENLLRDPSEEEDDSGVSFEEEGEDDETPSSPLSESEMSSEDLKRYLETLRPEDFGKFNP